MNVFAAAVSNVSASVAVGGAPLGSSEMERLAPGGVGVCDGCESQRGESCLLTLGEPSGSEKSPGLPLSFQLSLISHLCCSSLGIISHTHTLVPAAPVHLQV